jgi:DNA-directed RNA polymerase I, II, and III subunit RPABC5
MPLPVRCFTCGCVLGLKWSRYFQYLQSGMSEREAMDAVGIRPKKYCCRALMLTTVDDTEKKVSQAESTEGFTFQSRVHRDDKPRIYRAI